MPVPRPAPGTAKWWVVGVAGCGLGSVLAIWLALANTVGQVTWTDTGYKVVSDRSVVVDFDVNRDPASPVTCRVRALDRSFGVVGVLDVTVPAGGPSTVHRQAVVRTASRAVTGTVQSCSKAR